jgi:hypothetical protein
MIGQLTFWIGTRQHTAALTDGLDWSCDDPAIEQELSETFPAEPAEDVPNLVVGRHLLYQTASRLGGRVEVPLRRSSRVELV